VLTSSKRLVVKIGSSILVDEKKGEIRGDWLKELAHDVARLHRKGCEIVLVSSGAMRLARELGPGKTIVTILCDGGSRYQSKLFNPAFLRDKKLPIPRWMQ